MERYPIETLPFPVRPGDDVHFVVDLDEGPAILTYRVTAVGVNDRARLIVYFEEGDDYEVGFEDRCFITTEDARSFIEDEEAFRASHGTYGIFDARELWPADMPFRPGTEVFTADDDPYERHHVFETVVYEVYFTEEGEVKVVDDMSCESCVVGESLDPCYLTYEEAHVWAYEHLREWHLRRRNG